MGSLEYALNASEDCFIQFVELSLFLLSPSWMVHALSVGPSW